MNKNASVITKTLAVVLFLSFMLLMSGCGVFEKHGYTYKYDVVYQYYFADSDKWETVKEKDCMTNLAPAL